MSIGRRVLVGSSVLAVVTFGLGACAPADSTVPACDDPGGQAIVLVAQSVPSATRLPCIVGLPAGWQMGGMDIRSVGTTFWLDSVVTGVHAVEVALDETCDATGASEIIPAADEVGAEVSVLPTGLDPFRSTRFIEFDGGCITYRYTFSEGTPATVALEIDASLATVPREAVAMAVRREGWGTLCGADAPPCLDPG